jgi:hypothetical protein
VKIQLKLFQQAQANPIPPDLAWNEPLIIINS